MDHCKRFDKYLKDIKKDEERNINEQKIIRLIYLLDYITTNIGPLHVEKFLKSNLFPDLNLKKYLKKWNFDNLDDKINFIIDIDNLEDELEDKKESIEKIHLIWKKFYLDKKMRIEKRKHITNQLKIDYDNLDSDIEKRRRNLIKNLVNHPLFKINEQKDMENIGVLCIAYTNMCHNACRHCMARRPMSKSFSYDKSLINSILKSASEYGIQCCLFTGGEPFLMLDEICYTIEKSNSPQIFITTSAEFAEDSSKNGQTFKMINRIKNSFMENKSKNKYGIFLQISFDNFHQEVIVDKSGKLSENSSLFKIANLIEIILKEFPEVGFALTSVRSGVKYNILKYLLRELDRRDIYVSNKDEVLELYSKMVGDFPEKGPELLRMDITFNFNKKTRDIFCGAQLLTKIGAANLILPWETTDSAHDIDDFRKMDVVDKLALESNMILIERDGNVYLGGSLAGKWSLGNLGSENLTDIIKRTVFDPLVLLINNDFGQLVRWVEEVNIDIIKNISEYPTGMEVMNKLLYDPIIRLYLTKRYILENDGYNQKLKDEIILEKSVKELKRSLFF